MFKGIKVQVYPVNVTYELHLWANRAIDITEAIKGIYCWTVEAQGNGATIIFDDILDQYKDHVDFEVLQSLNGFSFDVTVEPDASVDVSDPGSDLGTYYHSTMSLIAHSWFCKGFDVPLLRKIVMPLYASSSTVDDDFGDDALAGNVNLSASPSTRTFERTS